MKFPLCKKQCGILKIRKLHSMKSMFSGFAAALLIGTGAYFGLKLIDMTSSKTFSGENVRLNSPE